MTLPKSIAAYPDCERHFAEALESERGIRVTLGSPAEVTAYLARLNTYREKLRKQTKDIYPPEHPSHGRSPYDALQTAKDRENPNCILIRPYQANILKTEKL